VSVELLAGPLIAEASASRMPLTVSKPLLVQSERRYFPAARVQLSETYGCIPYQSNYVPNTVVCRRRTDVLVADSSDNNIGSVISKSRLLQHSG